MEIIAFAITLYPASGQPMGHQHLSYVLLFDDLSTRGHHAACHSAENQQSMHSVSSPMCYMHCAGLNVHFMMPA